VRSFISPTQRVPLAVGGPLNSLLAAGHRGTW